MTIEKPPYSFAAKYYNQLISESRGQSLCGLYFFLHDFWRFSNVLPRCLDVGCGTGGVFQFWDSSQLDPQSCGIDPASEMIALASVNCPQFEFESTDLLAFDSAIDTIGSFVPVTRLITLHRMIAGGSSRKRESY